MSLPGWQEILLILVVGMLLFGSKKLPEIGSGLGRAIRNFKKASLEPDEIDITPKASETRQKSTVEDEDKKA